VSRTIRAGGYVGAFMAAVDALSWIGPDRASLDSYQDPPKSLADLHDAVSPISKSGYERHHIVEQTPAEKAGYPRSMIDARDNLVRIPKWKHEEISSWYSTRNERFGYQTPRGYLRDKGWEERRQLGLQTLIEHGMLKP
jgi:hypothetical protein